MNSDYGVWAYNIKIVRRFWHENQVRGFHQGYLRPNGLICVSYEQGGVPETLPGYPDGAGKVIMIRIWQAIPPPPWK